jgi:hypothetical protein
VLLELVSRQVAALATVPEAVWRLFHGELQQPVAQSILADIKEVLRLQPPLVIDLEAEAIEISDDEGDHKVSTSFLPPRRHEAPLPSLAANHILHATRPRAPHLPGSFNSSPLSNRMPNLTYRLPPHLPAPATKLSDMVVSPAPSSSLGKHFTDDAP